MNYLRMAASATNYLKDKLEYKYVDNKGLIDAGIDTMGSMA